MFLKKARLAAFVATGLGCSSIVLADDFSDVYSQFQSAVENSKFDEGVKLGKQAWLLGSQKYGSQSENALKLHLSYANVLMMDGDVKAAIDEFDSLYDQYGDVFGEDSPITAKARIEMLATVNQVGYGFDDITEGLDKYLTRYLILSLDKVKFTSELERAATYYLAAGEVAQAKHIYSQPSSLRKMFEKTLELSRQQWGGEDFRTLESQYLLARIMEMSHKKDSAIQNYEYVASVFDEMADYSHPYALSSHARLVNLYEDRGESDKATVHCQAIGKMTPWQPDIEAEAIYRKNPEYPMYYAQRNMEGSAKLSFVIDSNGFPRDIEVEKSKGGGQFASEAKKAVAEWRFAPKFVDGQAVDSERRFVQIDFKVG